MDFQHLQVAHEDSIGTITINREKALNALNAEVLTELMGAVNELEDTEAVRVVIVTGAGKAFVAGADITEMSDMEPMEAREFAELGGQLGELMETSTKPYIAAVNGFALGGGCELALACDFIYASAKARFGQPEVKLGVIPGFGGTQRLSRRVGLAKAKELVFSGEMIDAAEALRIGLADAVLAPEELIERCRDMAKKIAANGPLAVAEAKRIMHLGQSMTLEHSLVLEQRAFGELFASDDQDEGMKAFIAKRPANFEGK